MGNMISGNLDGNFEKIAFYTDDIKRIISRYEANVVISETEPMLYLEMNGDVYPVSNIIDKDDIKPYFILLNSGEALNAKDYNIIFDIKELANELVTGTDVAGTEHLCRIHEKREDKKDINEVLNIDDIDKKIQTGSLCHEDMESLKLMIQKLRNGEFFELLTMEFSGKIKEVAKELIDFRKDIQQRIEPDIVEIAARDIPEASNQLEGINDTLEESTMKIMDINEEQMDIASKQLEELDAMVSGNGNGESDVKTIDDAFKLLNHQMETLSGIKERSMSMMEPLSFQDLVGQRIQKIIKLVRSMELRIEELIVSFGIKLQKHKEDPERTYDDLNDEVDNYISELKGPSRDGEGLDQAGIDDILNAL